MTQRDYVRNSGASKRRPHKKSSSNVPKIMIALAVAVLLAFVGILYFVAKNNQPAAKPPVTQTQVNPTSHLPSRPEERWSYIKELENREVISGAGEQNINSQKPLTAEQRQALEQMQADMRGNNRSNNSNNSNNSQTSSTANTSGSQSQTTGNSGSMIQCGSFKTMEGAESVRVKLAFAGIESKIVSNGGWNRVVLGPFAQRSQINATQQRLKEAGVTSCIVLTPGG